MKLSLHLLLPLTLLAYSRAEEAPAEMAELPVGKLAFVTGPHFGSAGTIVILGQKAEPFLGNHPQFTVDGNLVFSNPHPPKDSGRYAGGLYIRHLDTSTTTVVDDTDENDADSPCLSPDGSRLIFVKWPEGRQSSHIHACNLDGSGELQLTDGPQNDWNPRWSSDGKKIVFETTREGERQIYVMDADGGHPVNLTRNKVLCHSPSWSPDGTHIAYMSWAKSGRCNIFVMKSDGTEQTNLSRGKTRDSEPVWSPDGKWIAFTRTASNPPGPETMDVWIMKSDGSDQKPLTRNAEKISSYSMSWGK